MRCSPQCYLAFIPLNGAYGDIRQKSLTTAETREGDGKGVGEGRGWQERAGVRLTQ